MSFIHFFGNVSNNYDVTFNTLLQQNKRSLVLYALSTTTNVMPYLYGQFHLCEIVDILTKLQNEKEVFDETYFERLLSLLNLYLLKDKKIKKNIRSVRQYVFAR